MDRNCLIQLPGVGLCIGAQGDGPVTIFVHGFGGDMRTWDGLWASLPAERNYIRYDRRGFGKSIATHDETFCHADDLLGLMDVLRIDRCHLTGVSMGGSVALNIALARPDRVRSLALLSPGLTAWEWSDEWLNLWRPITAAARSGDLQQARSLWFAHSLFDTMRASGGIDILRGEIAQFAGDQWIDDRQAPALPVLDRLHELDLPVLLMTGAHDFIDFRLIASLIEAAVRDVTRYDAEKLGHLVHMEAPEWCRDMLTDFWSETERKK